MKVSLGSLSTPLGVVALRWRSDGALVGVELEAPSSSILPPPALSAWFEAYFATAEGGREPRLELSGTPFQCRVWEALRTIPPGTTWTYGVLAKHLGSGARAVGGACRANPCPIVVPCHRVVARRGLGGFGGDTDGRRLALKRWLLEHERRKLGRGGS